MGGERVRLTRSVHLRERERLEQVMVSLAQTLIKRGVQVIEMPSFLRSVSILFEKEIQTLPVMNLKLEQLGWGIDMMDSITYEQILFVFENDFFQLFEKRCNSEMLKNMGASPFVDTR